MTLETGYIVAALVAFVISIVLTPLVRELAKRHALLDIPNHRSSHTVPVPRLGGVAIGVATLTGAILAADYIGGYLVFMALAAILLSFLGFWDDTKTIGPILKYGVQVVAAVLAVAALRPTLLVSIPPIDFEINRLVGFVLAGLWITAFLNAYNFMDGVDGLAGGAGVIIAIGLVVIGGGFASFFLLPLVGALLGFLVWNINPASIFMGDSGSQFIGFLLAVGVLGPRGEAIQVVPALLLFSPILFDTGITLIRRLLRRENVFAGHREHLYQRLGEAGVAPRVVANVQCLLTAGACLAALGYVHTSGPQKLLYPFACVLVLVAYAGVVTAMERGAMQRSVYDRHSQSAEFKDKQENHHPEESNL